MKIKFKGIEWVKSSSYIEQGVKGNRSPKNKIYGGNGSFRCYTPAEVWLEFESDDGSIEINVYHDLKSATGGKRVTEKLINNLYSALTDVKNFEYENGRIYGLEEVFKSL